MFGVYARPDLVDVATFLKNKHKMYDFHCGEFFSHVFIVGGDGTLLEAVRRVPCIFNTIVIHLGLGRVNFYRSAPPTLPLENIVEKIESGQYKIIELMTLETSNCVAVNEISIYRREPGRLMSFKIVTEEGELVGRADGVIVSTPQGTTGYVISTFGPVVDYKSPVVVISFIAPYTSFLRPFVLSTTRVLVETREDSVLVCDGRINSISREFEIRRGDRRLKLAVVGEFNFLNRVFERLRSV